jgi:hypothetical protein
VNLAGRLNFEVSSQSCCKKESYPGSTSFTLHLAQTAQRLSRSSCAWKDSPLPLTAIPELLYPEAHAFKSTPRSGDVARNSKGHTNSGSALAASSPRCRPVRAARSAPAPEGSAEPLLNRHPLQFPCNSRFDPRPGRLRLGPGSRYTSPRRVAMVGFFRRVRGVPSTAVLLHSR